MILETSQKRKSIGADYNQNTYQSPFIQKVTL